VVRQDGLDQLEAKGLGESRDAEILRPLAFSQEADVVENLRNQEDAVSGMVMVVETYPVRIHGRSPERGGAILDRDFADGRRVGARLWDESKRYPRRSGE
jgi:hypothetical protein